MTETNQPCFPEGARVIGKKGAPKIFRGRTGTVTGFFGGSGYQISFDDGQIEYAEAMARK